MTIRIPITGSTIMTVMISKIHPGGMMTITAQAVQATAIAGIREVHGIPTVPGTGIPEVRGIHGIPEVHGILIGNSDKGLFLETTR